MRRWRTRSSGGLRAPGVHPIGCAPRFHRMVSPGDREHFAAIARALEDAEREAIERAALNPPGRNIEESFALSRFVLSRGSNFPREPEVAPAALWFARRHKASGE